MKLLDKLKINHKPRSGGLDLLKYIGPGLLVTVGFIDPGNWATNLAAGSEFGYALLWVVTFSSIMLIIIQHNVAHLGIVTGLCLSEATNKYMPRMLSRPILGSAMLASISTSLAEILGGAIALRMLFSIPIKIGAVIVTIACLIMLLSNTYSKIERWIIMFVSIIGLSFLYELALVDVNWGQARQERIIKFIFQLLLNDRFIFQVPFAALYHFRVEKEVVGHHYGTEHTHDDQHRVGRKRRFYPSGDGLSPIVVGNNAGVIFAAALLLAGISSTITSGIAGASIFAGFYGEWIRKKLFYRLFLIGLLSSYYSTQVTQIRRI
mgnify:CR=1 FL=1